MKNLAAAVVLTLGIAFAGSAVGQLPPPPSPNFRFPPPPPPPPPPHRAPEIDPASAIAGLTLLAGGLAVLRGRRRAPK